jgi:diacylglycerol kinase family enzyme
MFFNPSSGAKLTPDEATELRERARSQGIEVIDVTPGIDISATIREQLGQGRRLFMAAGGDGTINHVVQALVRSEASLAVVPIGTYNHFARDLGIPLDWREALEVALDNNVRQVDVARVNDRYFVNNLSIGLYPDLVVRREARGRDFPRWKARALGMWGTLRRYPHVSLTVDSEQHHEAIRTHMFMVSNNSYDLSRLGIDTPRPHLTEGRLTVYWLPHMPRLALMKFAAHFLAGAVTRTPGFRSFRTAVMKVNSRRPHLHVGVDGEVFAITTPLVITSVPQSLVVKVPHETAPEARGA